MRQQLICYSRKDLPYIDAILNEVMRIHPIAPMTFYEAAEDSLYRGTERLLSKYHNISDCVDGL